MAVKLLHLFLLVPLASFSQDGVFFIGDKTYSCSEKECLAINSILSCYPQMYFAKDESKGMVIFENNNDPGNGDKSGCIVGTCLLYLDDNTIIKLYDHAKRDVLNQNCSSVYYLTVEEVTRLKKTNIRSVRYNISSQYFSETQSYSFENKAYVKNNFYSLDNKSSLREVPRIDFPLIITALFEQ